MEAADRVYAAVVQKLRNEEPELMAQLANAREVDVAELQFIDIATSLANFIRFKFRLQASSFSEFMAGRTSLTEAQLDGALIFFGKVSAALVTGALTFLTSNFILLRCLRLALVKTVLA